jgi:hypothetical protein
MMKRFFFYIGIEKQIHEKNIHSFIFSTEHLCS